MKKVRNIRWHTVLIDTLKTETSSFVLNPTGRSDQYFSWLVNTITVVLFSQISTFHG